MEDAVLVERVWFPQPFPLQSDSLCSPRASGWWWMQVAEGPREDNGCRWILTKRGKSRWYFIELRQIAPCYTTRSMSSFLLSVVSGELLTLKLLLAESTWKHQRDVWGAFNLRDHSEVSEVPPLTSEGVCAKGHMLHRRSVTILPLLETLGIHGGKVLPLCSVTKVGG